MERMKIHDPGLCWEWACASGLIFTRPKNQPFSGGTRSVHLGISLKKKFSTQMGKSAGPHKQSLYVHPVTSQRVEHVDLHCGPTYTSKKVYMMDEEHRDLWVHFTHMESDESS